MKEISNLDITTAWGIWRECLLGEDPNAIFQQITRMIWDTAIFQIINEGRRLQINKNPKCPEINSPFHNFINRAYVQSQCASIRRLTDLSSPLIGEKGVYSLSELIKVMSYLRESLTRTKFFELRGLQYDYSEVVIKRNEFFKKMTPGRAVDIPSEYNLEYLEETHQAFDQLSGVTKSSRSPNDVVLEEVYTTLQSDLREACSAIDKFVNKFIAHSATKESRRYENGVIEKIQYRQLWDAQRIIYQIAGLISSMFFGVSHIALALESPNFYSYWDKPIFPQDAIDQVEVVFEKYRKETEDWRLGAESYYQYMSQKREY
ncbi:MAG: hypothetical protein AAGU75_14095 [Bacillota bacterium]